MRTGYTYGGASAYSPTAYSPTSDYRPPSPSSYSRPTASAAGAGTGGLYSYTTRTPSPHAQHQGSPLKERPTYGRATSPLSAERAYAYPTTPTKTTYGERPLAGMRERPSVLADNPYSLGATSYKSGLSYLNPGGSPSATLTPTKQTPPGPHHGASFNSGVYGTAGTPNSAQRYGSPTNSPGGGRQRIRGTSFREDYNGLSPRSRRLGRAPSMLGQPGTMMIPPQHPSDHGKYSIVLDLDETLIYARDGPLYARPGVDDLFEYIGSNTEAIAWTAGLRAYAQAVLANIDKTSSIKHCVYRHSKWFTGQAGYQKELSLLGRSLDRVLIVENTPDCIRANRENGILVQDYEGGELADATIPRLLEVIRGLVQSGLSVPDYLARCPLLSRRKVPTDKGDYIECYWLEVNNPVQGSVRYVVVVRLVAADEEGMKASTHTHSPRYNRDLSTDQRFVFVCPKMPHKAHTHHPHTHTAQLMNSADRLFHLLPPPPSPPPVPVP